MSTNRYEDDNIVTFKNANGEDVELEYLDSCEYGDTKYYIFATCEESDIVIMKCIEDEEADDSYEMSSENFMVETDETIIKEVFEIFKRDNMDVFFLFGSEEEWFMRTKSLRKYKHTSNKHSNVDSKKAREAYYKAIAWQKELEEQEFDSMIETLKSIPVKDKDS